MASEWPTKQLREVAEVIDSLHKSPQYQNIGLPMVRVTDIKPDSIDLANCNKVSEEDFIEFSRRYKPESGDLLITRVGSYGITAQVKRVLDFCIGQNIAAIKPQNIHSVFLFYCFQSSVVKQQIEQRVVGSTQKTLSLANINELEIPLPPLPEQKAIAAVLGSLDDKIELNRRMNETLEATAKALFKSWFVDFDPVRAKTEGRQPEGLAPEIAALFPNGFEDSELGEIPNGWKWVSFDELAEAKQGKYLPAADMAERPYLDTPYPVWGGNGVRGYTKNTMYSEPVTVMTCRGSNCGLILFTESPSWVSNISFACLPKYGSNEYLYIYFSLESFIETISGSAQPQITSTSLKSKMMKFPVEKHVCNQFSELIHPVFKKIRQLNTNSRTLASIRNTLLPRLMSGELRVCDAQKLVEGVTT